MRDLLALLALLSLVCLLNAAVGDWEPCNSTTTVTLDMGNNRLESNGYKARVRPITSNGALLPVSLAVEVFAVQEWLLPSAQSECQFVGRPFSPGTSVLGMVAYRSLNTSDFECQSTLRNLTLPNGVSAEQISTVMRHTTFSNFTFTFNWTHSSGSYDETYPGTANSDYLDVVHKYRCVVSRWP